MNRPPQRKQTSREVIDVDAPLPPIDLTGSDDEIVCTGATSQIVCTGASWDTTGSLQWKRENEWRRQEERKRAELRERQRAREREWERRQQGNATASTNGSGGMRSNVLPGAGGSARSSIAMIASTSKVRTSSAGPLSTIRPEIEHLGTRIQNWRDSESPRKRPRISVEGQHAQPAPTPVPANPETHEPTYKSEFEYESIDATMDTGFATSSYEPTITPITSFRLTPQFQPTTRPIRPARRKFPQDFIIPKVEPNHDPDIDVEPKFEPDASDEDEEVRSDEEYERIHSGYDIHDEPRWKEPKQNTARLETIIGSIKDWTISDNASTKEQKRRFDTSRPGKKVRPSGNMFVWDLLGQIRQPASATKSMQKPSVLKRGPTYGRILPEKAMHVQASFKVAPGAINRIEQHGGWLAIGSSCIGGQADEPDEQPNPYNRSGSVLTWNGEYHVLTGHYDKKAYGDKYYAVNDVKFNSAGNCFVSAGMDKKVRVWKRPQGSSGYSGGYDLDTYDGIPYEVAFQPENPDSDVVAVGVKDIHVYSNLEPTAKRTKMTLPLATEGHPNHCAGAIRWDSKRPHLLYTSSEPQDDRHDGVHKVFDVNKGKLRLTFNVHEAGDAMAVGHVLALATRGESNNFLRIFDINGFGRNCAQKAILEPFAGRVSSKEVSCITFSPDGIYLALGRSDNSVHVYDSRMLGSKGVLQKYQHQDARFVSPEHSLYGVTNVHWITQRSGQFTLLSGGEDGCVRLWNPMWSGDEPSNGRKIVEVNSDIGFFSVGDPFKEEHDLVVGDSSGEVKIFTGLLNFY
ncbi:WD40 repeat-like protein [Macrolepiota fuliginosa MF-IS2]|uniref:WD40 repeat-like protein n=1 Tax=Macrolepiota fuliginosa MF-IS2 TaxID=1400762 RepID=A0A9P5XMK5_9AGAR|nr:WD40 repeat-like protein [Macrolepiota fuliginosa MF-IS2]